MKVGLQSLIRKLVTNEQDNSDSHFRTSYIVTCCTALCFLLPNYYIITIIAKTQPANQQGETVITVQVILLLVTQHRIVVSHLTDIVITQSPDQPAHLILM